MQGTTLARKPLVTAPELEALLSKPTADTISVDPYFPLRLAILTFFSAVWFLRLTLFTHDVANDLFSNPDVRNYMMPALYFRAWILFVFMVLYKQQVPGHSVWTDVCRQPVQPDLRH